MTTSNLVLPLALAALAVQLFGCDLVGDDAGNDDQDADTEGMDPSAGSSAPEAEESSSEGGDTMEESSGSVEPGTPADLVGVWIHEEDESLLRLTLRADGTFVDEDHGSDIFDACAWTWAYVTSGDFTVAGDVLFLDSTSGTEFFDNCGMVTEGDYLRDVEYRWALDESGETLTLTLEQLDIVYQRQ